MGKILIGLAMLTLPVAVSLTLVFSEALTTIGVAISLGASIFVFFCGIYAGFLGIKYERLQQKFESFVNPLRIRPNPVNLIKAICPIDQQQVVFVHVSPHRDESCHAHADCVWNIFQTVNFNAIESSGAALYVFNWIFASFYNPSGLGGEIGVPLMFAWESLRHRR